jgi:hypothetical protein
MIRRAPPKSSLDLQRETEEILPNTIDAPPPRARPRPEPRERGEGEKEGEENRTDRILLENFIS